MLGDSNKREFIDLEGYIKKLSWSEGTNHGISAIFAMDLILIIAHGGVQDTGGKGAATWKVKTSDKIVLITPKLDNWICWKVRLGVPSLIGK